MTAKAAAALEGEEEEDLEGLEEDAEVEEARALRRWAMQTSSAANRHDAPSLWPPAVVTMP